MADVTCPLTREDLAALLADGALPAELRVALQDPARTIELGHGYEMELLETEARSLLAHAASHDLRVAAARWPGEPTHDCPAVAGSSGRSTCAPRI